MCMFIDVSVRSTTQTRAASLKDETKERVYRLQQQCRMAINEHGDRVRAEQL
jgi:hypothetical protein